MFGTLLNNIVIDRVKSDGSLEKRFLVPISYGAGEKWVTRLSKETTDLTRTPAIVLPRIAFELIDLSYDGTRKLFSLDNYKKSRDEYEFLSANPPAPYNLTFTVTIIAKYAEDATRIVEQILPWFKPDWTSQVRIIDNLDIVLDIPVILNSVSTQEIYEGDFEQRRVVQWTLDFTMKAYYFGPTNVRKVIKFVDVNLYPSFDPNSTSEEIHITPGMTLDRKPTKKKELSIPYQQIEFNDPWDYVTEIISIEDKD